MSYPLFYAPPWPGPRPPWWRPLARKRHDTIMEFRNSAKRLNFGKLYGVGVPDLSVTEFTHKPTSKS